MLLIQLDFYLVEPKLKLAISLLFSKNLGNTSTNKPQKIKYPLLT